MSYTAVSIKKDLLAKVKTAAAAQDRSAAWFIRKAIEAYLEAKPSRTRKRDPEPEAEIEVPTIEVVVAEFRVHGVHDPREVEKFYAYWTQKGWTRNWKIAASNWIRIGRREGRIPPAKVDPYAGMPGWKGN